MANASPQEWGIPLQQILDLAHDLWKYPGSREYRGAQKAMEELGLDTPYTLYEKAVADWFAERGFGGDWKSPSQLMDFLSQHPDIQSPDLPKPPRELDWLEDNPVSNLASQWWDRVRTTRSYPGEIIQEGTSRQALPGRIGELLPEEWGTLVKPMNPAEDVATITSRLPERRNTQRLDPELQQLMGKPLMGPPVHEPGMEDWGKPLMGPPVHDPILEDKFKPLMGPPVHEPGIGGLGGTTTSPLEHGLGPQILRSPREVLTGNIFSTSQHDLDELRRRLGQALENPPPIPPEAKILPGRGSPRTEADEEYIRQRMNPPDLSWPLEASESNIRSQRKADLLNALEEQYPNLTFEMIKQIAKGYLGG